jgi:hypothetical protein
MKLPTDIIGKNAMGKKEENDQGVSLKNTMNRSITIKPTYNTRSRPGSAPSVIKLRFPYFLLKCVSVFQSE